MNMEMDPKSQSYKAFTELIPLGLLIIILLIIACPFNNIYRSSRFFLLKCALHCIAAPLYKEVPEKTKEGAGKPWQFVGLLPPFDPPRHDSAETIHKALYLGVNVKMITGDQLVIAKETGRRLGMRTNMYPSSSLLGQDKDASITALPVDELIEKVDGIARVFPKYKYEIVKLQERKHICGMTGGEVNDALALKKADIGIVVTDATDAARGASDIVLTEPELEQSLIKGILARARGRLLITSQVQAQAVLM